jgi:hypothetical protein
MGRDNLIYLLLESLEHEMLQSCLPALESPRACDGMRSYSLVYLLLERPEHEILQSCLPSVRKPRA